MRCFYWTFTNKKHNKYHHVNICKSIFAYAMTQWYWICQECIINYTWICFRCLEKVKHTIHGDLMVIYLPSKQSPSTNPRIPPMLPLFMRPFFIFQTFAPDSRRRPSALARLTVRFSASPSRRSRPSWQGRPMGRWNGGKHHGNGISEPEEFPNQRYVFRL